MSEPQHTANGITIGNNDPETLVNNAHAILAMLTVAFGHHGGLENCPTNIGLIEGSIRGAENLLEEAIIAFGRSSS